MLSMLRNLDRTRVDPQVILGEPSDLVRLIEDLDIPVTIVNMPKRSRGTLFGWWRSVTQVTNVARQFEPDILHANDVPSCQALSVVGRQLLIPRVVHVRWGITAHAAGWWARRGAECVLCISEWVRRQLGDLKNTPLGGASIEHVVDAVDWPASPDAQKARSSLLDKPGDKPVLGFAGQLIEDKGLDLVIEAMGLMAPEDRPRLLVAGEDTQSGGVYKRHLQHLAAQCNVDDAIEWLGFLPDIDQLYGRVHAMVCPSRVEPLGLVPLEAARFGIPTFASRDGGFIETIDHNVTGVLVKPTSEGWAKALKQAQIYAWLKELGLAAHERTARLYSPAIYQRRLMDIYARLARAGVNAL